MGILSKIIGNNNALILLCWKFDNVPMLNFELTRHSISVNISPFLSLISEVPLLPPCPGPPSPPRRRGSGAGAETGSSTQRRSLRNRK